MSAAFTLEAVTKSFTTEAAAEVLALRDVSFSSEEGRVTCLLGPTGAGKTTVLRLLAGLETPDSGRVGVSGAGIGYLTQRHTLLPWRNVVENIALPLELRGIGKEERHQRAREIAMTLGLGDAVERYPWELSGGMQQRAAIGRLLASEARYWLLDEPFSSLDERTQHGLEVLILDLIHKHSLSAIVVTHSIDEAVWMGDRIVMLSAGPATVTEVIDLDLPRPRDRRSAEYGAVLNRIRIGLESVLG